MNTLVATTNMNNMYRRQRHFYDATRKFYLLGRDMLIDGLKAGPQHAVLEIGCGTARNLIIAGDRYPQARLFGIDVSTEMLETAIKKVDRAGLAGRVRVAHADAVKFDPQRIFGQGRFDRIFMSYCLSMIPDWRAALDFAAALLAPDGELHIVDFGHQERLPGFVATGMRWWLGSFSVVPRRELEAYLIELAMRQGALLSFARPYRSYAQYAVLRRASLPIARQRAGHAAA
jgi:S-adenosylmethionine-diacylgycerolhomoserine-N-methlytransferase